MTDVVASDVRASMDEVAAGLPTKSAKIRALDQAGYTRADIARYLGIRYRHIYNVLKQSKSDEPPPQIWVKVGEAGRVVIPARYRKALGLKPGDDVLLWLEDEELHVVSRDAAIKRAQAMVAKYFPGDESLSDRLIAERRREAAREEEALSSGS